MSAESVVGCSNHRAIDFTDGGIITRSAHTGTDPESGLPTYDITFENLTNGWYAGEVVTERTSTCYPTQFATIPLRVHTGLGRPVIMPPGGRVTWRDVPLETRVPLVVCFTGLFDETGAPTDETWLPLVVLTDMVTTALTGEPVFTRALHAAQIGGAEGALELSETILNVASAAAGESGVADVIDAVNDFITADNIVQKTIAVTRLFGTTFRDVVKFLFVVAGHDEYTIEDLEDALDSLTFANASEVFHYAADLGYAYHDYPFTAVAVEVYEQQSARDTLPPDGRILVPAEGAQVGSRIVVEGDATDECSGVAFVNLTYTYNNGVTWRFLGQDTTAPYRFDVDLSSVPDGQTVRFGWDVYDLANHHVNSPHGNVSVVKRATQPPVTLAAAVLDSPPSVTAAPQQVVRYTWRLRNIGDTPWTAQDTITLGAGARTTLVSASVPPLAPGGVGDATLDVRIPDGTGTFADHAQLKRGAASFGPILLVGWHTAPPPPPVCASGITCADGACASNTLPGGGEVARVAGSEELWAIEGGRRHRLTGTCSDAFSERRARARCVTPAAISSVPSAPQVCSDGSFVRPLSSARVYRREGGRLRALCGAWTEAGFTAAYGAGFEIVLPVTSTELGRLDDAAPFLLPGIYATGSIAPACGQPGYECASHDDPDDHCWGQLSCPSCAAGDVCSDGNCVATPDPSYESDTILPSGFVQAPRGPLVGGATVSIGWYAEDATGIASARIEYTLDAWATAHPVHATNLLAGPYQNTIQNPTGVVSWSVPNAVTDRAGLRMAITDRAGNWRVVYAPSFAISSGTAPPTCPIPSAPALGDPGLLSESGQYPLTWLAVPDATAYQLEEALDGTFSSAFSGATVVGLSYLIAGRQNARYYYRVRAESSCGASPWSNVVDILVDRNEPPAVPSGPSPSIGASGIDRAVTLAWTGGDDGVVEYAVRLGTDRAAMPIVRAYGPTTSAGQDLAAGTLYHWQVLARDDEGAVTEGPIWSFTTANQLADIAVESVTITSGTVAPGASVTASTAVANRGTRASLPGMLGIYLGTSAGDRGQLLARIDVPALAPGEERTLATTMVLRELPAGTSYASAILEPETIFEDASAANNAAAATLVYTDASSPAIVMLELRYGTGPGGTRYQTDHDYNLVYDVRDDVGATTLELAYQVSGDATWRSITTITGAALAQGASLYTWRLPASTPLGPATLRAIARDGSDNQTTRTFAFEVIDGAVPAIAMVSHMGGQPVSLGRTSTIEWNVSTTHGLGQIVISLYYGDQISAIVSLPSPGTSTYAWNVPNSASYLSSNARLQVRAIDLLGNEAIAWSAPFAIVDDAAPPPEPWGQPTVLTSAGGCGVPFCLQRDHERVAIAVDGADVVHIAYTRTQIDMRDGTSGSYYVAVELLYRRSNGTGFTAEEAIATFPMQILPSTNNALFIDDLAIDTDAAGNPHVAWAMKEMNNFVADVYATRKTTSWEAATNLSNNATYSHMPRVVVGTDDAVHVLWRDGSPERLLHRRTRPASGGAWGVASTSLAGTSFSYFAAAGGPSGTVHTVYNVGSSVYATVLANDVWAAPSVAMSCPTSIVDPTLAVRPDGTRAVAAAFWDAGTATIGYGATCEPLVRWEGSTISRPTVRWDSRSLPLVAWRSEGTQTGIFFRRGLAAEAWSDAIRISTASHFPQQQLAFDARGTTAHVVYMAFVSGHNEVIHTTAELATDIYAPTVTVDPLAATLGAATAIELGWSAEDDTAVTSIEVSYTRDGGATFVPIATLPGSADRHTWTVPSTPGALRVRVEALDAAGNRGVAESLDATVADLAPPSVSISAPASGASLAVGSDVTITWTATDNVGVTRIDVVLVEPGAPATLIAADLSAPQSSVVWRPADECAGCAIRVDAHDAAGRIASATIPVTAAWSNRAPVVPFGPSPSDLATGLDPTRIELAWNSADADGDVVRYDLYVDDVVVATATTATGFALVDLAPETSHRWRVVATDGRVATSGPEWRFTTGAVFPPAPSNVAIVGTAADRVSISWTTSPTDATCVERRTGAGAFAEIVELAPGIQQLDDVAVTGNTAYTYRLCARRNGRTSPYSAELTAETANTPPRTPEALTPAPFSTVAPASVDLTWLGGDPDPGAVVRYRVLFGDADLVEVAADLTVATLTVGPLSYGTLYSWRVIAEDDRGVSIASPTFSFATMAPPGLPSPGDLQGQIRDHELVVLTWSAVADAASYEVERNAGSGWTVVASVSATTYADPAPMPEGDYLYRVRARRGSQVSPPSAEVTVDTRNHAPSFTTTLPTEAIVGVLYEHPIDASDPESDALEFSLVAGPSGMTVDSSRVRWTPTEADIGAQLVTIAVTDELGAMTTQTVEVQVRAAVDEEPEPDAGGCCGAGRGPSGVVLGLLTLAGLLGRRRRVR